MRSTLKTRIYAYLTGLLLIFQLAVFLQVSNTIWYTNLVKGLAFSGLLLIGALSIYTLILVAKKKARVWEFMLYTAGLIGLMLIAAVLFVANIAKVNSTPHPMGDTTRHSQY